MINKKIVLTGGPCAGKTTVAEVLLRAFEDKIVVVPESASLLFRGGFPRWPNNVEAQCSLQRAIFYVQHELENAYDAQYSDRVLILDRGTVDGAAYWPRSSEDFFQSLGSSLEEELSRYYKVIYLESAGEDVYDIHKKRNPLRIESWEEAKKLDELTRQLWLKHPKIHIIHNRCSFSEKIFSVLRLIEEEFSGDISTKS